MATKLFTVGNSGNHGKQVGFHCLCAVVTKLFTIGQKRLKDIAVFRCKGSVDILNMKLNK
jgi:hypothetical protein